MPYIGYLIKATNTKYRLSQEITIYINYYFEDFK